MIDLIDGKLITYIEDHTDTEPAVLTELNRETHSKVLMPQMLSGNLQGRMLSLISKIIQPDRILEIGTYTGYSAICLAEGLSPTGKLHTIDINEELRKRAIDYFQKASLSDKIILHTGNALDIIPTLDETFDLVFIDADKINYSIYYDLAFNKLRQGGIIIADNALWSGKVLDKKRDEDTQGIVDFNDKVQQDDRIENVLFPVRDGLMVIRKK